MWYTQIQILIKLEKIVKILLKETKKKEVLGFLTRAGMVQTVPTHPINVAEMLNLKLLHSDSYHCSFVEV